MFLFIFESIGTSELLLIGLVALIFLGPRKLPQIAKTLGKTLNEFRNTTNEFKATWEREVNFEEEERAIRTGEISDTPVSRMTPAHSDADNNNVLSPAVKQIDKSAFDDLAAVHSRENQAPTEENDSPEESPSEKATTLSDKRNWL